VRKREFDARLPKHGGNVHAFARAHGLQPDEVLDFSASINPLGWPRGVAAAYRKALSQAVHYPEPYAETLTTALANYHALDPTSLLVGNGSTQLIYLFARVLASQNVLIISPTFSEHESAFRLAGASVSRFYLRPPAFALLPEQLQRKLAEGYDTVVLTNPNSPIGVLVPRATVETVVRQCRRMRIRLLIDETFIDWVEEESVKELATRHASLIVLRSMTKFFALPGLRIGYTIAHPRVIARLRQQLEPWSVNSIAQAVGVACLADSQFAQRSRAIMERERRWFAQQLATIAGFRVFPSQANFLLVQLEHRRLTAADLSHKLAEHHILIRDCANFPGLGKQYFRVAVRQRKETRRLLAALMDIVRGRSVVRER